MSCLTTIAKQCILRRRGQKRWGTIRHPQWQTVIVPIGDKFPHWMGFSGAPGTHWGMGPLGHHFCVGPIGPMPLMIHWRQWPHWAQWGHSFGPLGPLRMYLSQWRLPSIELKRVGPMPNGSNTMGPMGPIGGAPLGAPHCASSLLTPLPILLVREIPREIK